MTQQLRILTGYGKPKSIGLSFLKSHPPAICWLSSKPTLRRSDRKEQHMNNIRNALRYIYIYILTHATAGWAHDRQPREVCEERNKDRRRNDNADLGLIHRALLHAEREVPELLSQLVERSKRIHSNSRRGKLLCSENRRIIHRLFHVNKLQNNGCVQSERQIPYRRPKSSRRLTPKEVAA